MIHWALSMTDGLIVRGADTETDSGVGIGKIVDGALFGVFISPSGVPVFVSGGVDVMWTVRRVVGDPRSARALGLRSVAGDARVWMMPDGSMGLGRSTQEITKAFAALEDVARRLACLR